MIEKLNLVEEGFMHTIERGAVKTYASINAEMYSDKNELAPTGQYFVYLLHSVKGSCYFNVEQALATGEWFSKNAPSFVEADIILEIGTVIHFKKEQVRLTSMK